MARYNLKHISCKINGCTNKHEALGYCQKHYNSFYRWGNPLANPHQGRVKTGKYLDCQTCGKPTYVIFSRFHKKHFCSKKCYTKYQLGKHPSLKTILKKKQYCLEKSASWKGGKTQTPEGYILIKHPKHPIAKFKGGYVYEHRLTMEKKLGRYLRNEEHIHHINGKKDDNRISNLVVMSNTDHRKLHCRKH